MTAAAPLGGLPELAPSGAGSAPARPTGVRGRAPVSEAHGHSSLPRIRWVVRASGLTRRILGRHPQKGVGQGACQRAPRARGRHLGRHPTLTPKREKPRSLLAPGLRRRTVGYGVRWRITATTRTTTPSLTTASIRMYIVPLSGVHPEHRSSGYTERVSLNHPVPVESWRWLGPVVPGGSSPPGPPAPQHRPARCGPLGLGPCAPDGTPARWPGCSDSSRDGTRDALFRHVTKRSRTRPASATHPPGLWGVPSGRGSGRSPSGPVVGVSRLAACGDRACAAWPGCPGGRSACLWRCRGRREPPRDPHHPSHPRTRSPRRCPPPLWAVGSPAEPLSFHHRLAAVENWELTSVARMVNALPRGQGNQPGGNPGSGPRGAIGAGGATQATARRAGRGRTGAKAPDREGGSGRGPTPTDPGGDGDFTADDHQDCP